MVGHMPLKHVILVRIQAPQHKKLPRSCGGNFLLLKIIFYLFKYFLTAKKLLKPPRTTPIPKSKNKNAKKFDLK